MGPARISLGPRPTYNQRDQEPRAMISTDHQFKFTQNLRQGLPLNQTQMEVASMQTTQSPLSRLATNMLLPRSVPQSNIASENYIQGVQQERLAQLQPPKQQITPPFNLTPPMAHGIQLVSPHELPDRFRQVFPYELFNAVQSKCFAPIYQGNDNIVVSAPTGCGKTVLLELAICKLAESHRSGEFKIVYQAPTKSLCSERVRDWTKKFSHLNLACAEFTGDTEQSEMNKIRNASIIITTPEKWDSMTRKWSDHQKLLQMVKLFLIDEVHILKDIRGATLEAVVSRMKACAANVRFVATSATVPNSQDIAVWLGKDHVNQRLPAHREAFGEDFRPVKLQKIVHGFECKGNDFQFEKVLDSKLPTLLQKYTQKKPIMVFCLTRKSCEGTAVILAEWWTGQRVVDRAWPLPIRRTVVVNKELQSLVECGVAFHHAGLEPMDRMAVETAYLQGGINVICCTSTLAVGVNLPCHLVVLKGTVGFQSGSLAEYSDLEVMQMLGRAGRPQFDDSAIALILTRSRNVDRYKQMISGKDILESTLHLNLIEHLNSEIGLGTIKNLHTAQLWLNGTFLSVRMRQNLDYYKLEGIAPSRDVDEQLRLDHQLITQKNTFGCTEYGNAMSRYMVQFATMKLLLGLPSQVKPEQILNVLCQAPEFGDLRIKANERSLLKELNKSASIKYPVQGPIYNNTSHKISIIIQAQLGGVELPDDKDISISRRQYAMERTIIFERAQRLVRCIIDCKSWDCDAVSTRHALLIARSIAAESWESSNLQLRQLPHIGPAAIRKLAAGNINSVEKFASLETNDIERIIGRNPPFGRNMLNAVAWFPLLTITAGIIETLPPISGENPKVKLKVCLGYKNSKVPTWNGKKPSLTFMAETSGGNLVHFWRANIQKLRAGAELKFTVELSSPEDEISCCFACDEIVGTVQSFRLNHNIPASAFPPPAKRIKNSLSSVKEEQCNEKNDDFGDGEFEDEELLAAVENFEAPRTDYRSDNFRDIDEIDDPPKFLGVKVDESEEGLESTQLENGRWTCNHHCSRGRPLKNGQPCKHKCCSEGLDKPRKVRKREPSQANSKNHRATENNPRAATKSTNTKEGWSYTRTYLQTIVNNPKLNRGSTYSRSTMFDDEHYAGAEVIGLAEGESQVPYSKLTPREYSKLHKLQTTAQEGINVRRLKRKPQFSYASGDEPDLPFLRQDPVDHDDPLDSPDLPKPSWGTRHTANSVSSMHGGSMDSLEAAMLDLDDPVLPEKPPLPKLDSSFENGVIDYDACGKGTQDENVYSSPLMRAARQKHQLDSPCPIFKRAQELSFSPGQSHSNQAPRSDPPVTKHQKAERALFTSEDP
ncbi:Sec63 Brl domain-containing protein [Bisporella sp. PMI_857]|nr:Sec63 Brl domain-containing protein [Bisporella sp. PMI_857]